jgi:pyrophosphate--fructose-6-phosphate 1-phosphotransferase
MAQMMNMERRHGKMVPVIKKALVELDGPAFKEFEKHRASWAKETQYAFPGPIQYFGPTEVCDRPTITLELEATASAK